MFKKLIAACFAVWIGIVCLYNSPDNPSANLIPADNSTIAPDYNSQFQIGQPADAASPGQDENTVNPPVKAPQPAQPGTSSTKTETTPPVPVKVNPSRAAAVKPSTDTMATEMLNLINAERSKNQLKPLVLDSSLSDGANLKSKDMAVNGYFSHTSPTYGDPFAMMERLGITYRAAGENIARNRSVTGAHTAFMNSAGHRQNILSPAYGKIGLGFYQQGGDLYVTQWFTN